MMNKIIDMYHSLYRFQLKIYFKVLNFFEDLKN